MPCEISLIVITLEGDRSIQHHNFEILIIASAASETTLAITDFMVATVIAADIIICNGNSG